jgi:hypothetical protein
MSSRTSHSGACLVRILQHFPDSEERIALRSLFSDRSKELWISISGFESLGGSQYSCIFPETGTLTLFLPTSRHAEIHFCYMVRYPDGLGRNGERRVYGR